MNKPNNVAQEHCQLTSRIASELSVMRKCLTLILLASSLATLASCKPIGSLSSESQNEALRDPQHPLPPVPPVPPPNPTPPVPPNPTPTPPLPPTPTPTPPVPPAPTPTPTPTPPPPPGPTPRATLVRQGEFLVCNDTNENYNINFAIPNGTRISKIVLDFDVYVSNWDPNKSDGYHNLFWLQRGTYPRPFRWEDNTIGYMNLRGPAYQGGRITLETTINGHYNQGKRHNAPTGRTYHMSFVFHATEGYARYVFSHNGQVEHELQVPLSSQYIDVINNGLFIQFGSQVAEEGPEAMTYGWRFSNLNLRVY